MVRRFVLSVLFLLLVSCATTPQQRPARFKILQINDVYKIEGLEGGNAGGLARVRTLRRHLEDDGTPVLVLHGGDLLYPSVMSKYLEARPMIDVMNLLDGDAVKDDERLLVGFGNHEFDNKTGDILLQRLNESQFGWLGTNTRWCNPACDQRFPRTTDIREYDFGGTKVAVIGLLYPQQKSYAASTDVIEAAADAVRVARSGGARVVIAITHQDMSADLSMVQKVLGIDLVIGGHDHRYMLDRVDRTWISKADADAKSVVVYDVTVDDAGVHTTPLRVLLDTHIPKDKAIDTRVQYWLGELSKELGGNETIATTKNLLEGVEPVVRGRESALGNVLTDVARQHMGTDVGILNGGSIRINDNIPPGPITKYDMEGIFYFTNRLVAFTATGQQLLDLLRHGVSRADAGDGRFLQVSGVSFTYHPRDGAYVVNAEDVRVGGKPLDLNATYSVATIDFLYEQGEGDGFTLFSDANRPAKINAEREADFRATVEAAWRAAGTIDTDVEGRIVRD
ncbi:MAG TPA: 5'-nucleotidase C-terminal domain-containing protein [Thermoanaerobaculia bacterium]|nr:5'-nucleotidase C-terminal domain-containing protein [Thermoanaerobaculia bacterium]